MTGCESAGTRHGFRARRKRIRTLPYSTVLYCTVSALQYRTLPNSTVQYDARSMQSKNMDLTCGWHGFSV